MLPAATGEGHSPRMGPAVAGTSQAPARHGPRSSPPHRGPSTCSRARGDGTGAPLWPRLWPGSGMPQVWSR